jgi:hypothetical protein
MSKKIPGRGPTRFALCIDSGEHPASLEPRKLYEVLHDEDAARHGQLRVIDESGDDYLYPREYFQPVDLSPALNRLVRGNGGRRRQVARTARRAGKIRPTR